jgi:competence protein ComEC
MNSRWPTAISRTVRRPSDQPLVTVFLGAAAGIVLDRVATPSWPLISAPTWWCGAVLGWIGWWIFRLRRRDALAAACVLGSLGCLSGMWHHSRWNLFCGDELALFATERSVLIRMEAILERAPRRLPPPRVDPLRLHRLDTRSMVDLRAVALCDAVMWRSVSGRARLVCQGVLEDLHAGDRVRIVGRLGRPSAALNPGEFDLAEHCRSDRRLSTIWADQAESVVLVSRGCRFSPRRVLDDVRRWGHGFLESRLGPSQQGLAAAMLLGLREELTTDQTERFFLTGTIHLLVVSGLHLGMLAGGLALALRVVLAPGSAIAVAVAAVAVSYAMLTGAQPPVVRAAVLVVIACAGRFLGRDALGLNSLAAAALVVLAISPADLFRTGPQLSFLAVAALIWFSTWRFQRGEPLDPLDELIRQTRPAALRWARAGGEWLIGLSCASAAVWLVVQPLVMARFHLLSPAAVLLGPLLWLPVATGLMTGFAALVVGGAVPLCGTALAWICGQSLAVTQAVVRTAEEFPGSHFWVTGPSGWWLTGFYLLAAIPLVTPWLAPPLRRTTAALSGWVALGFCAGLAGDGPDGSLRCTFLAVGHGCAVVLECPGGERILYDAGSSGPPDRTARSIAGYLWSRGIRRIDAIVLSHADLDHYNAVPELLERFDVGEVITAEPMFSGRSPGVDVLSRSLARARVPVRHVAAGDRLRVSAGTMMEVLHPLEGDVAEGLSVSDNSQSVVLAVEYAGRRVLLPGDLEPPGLFALLAQPPIDCDVLLAPHHGSRHSYPEGFARWSTPEWVVVSGASGSAGDSATAGAYEARGAVVLATQEYGAIGFRIDREAVRCEIFGGKWLRFRGADLQGPPYRPGRAGAP